MSSKVDLLMRVNKLQLEIQKSRLLLREALRREKKFVELTGKSTGEERANSDHLGYVDDETKVRQTKDTEINQRTTAQLFLQIIGSAFTSIDQVLSSQQLFEARKSENSVSPGSTGYSASSSETVEYTAISPRPPECFALTPESSKEPRTENVLVLCKDSSDIGEANLIEVDDDLAFGRTIKLAVSDLETCRRWPALIERADRLVFYHFDLADLWQALKAFRTALHGKRLVAVVAWNLKMFLSEFQQRIKLKLI